LPFLFSTREVIQKMNFPVIHMPPRCGLHLVISKHLSY
jgi:hypothetical protein